MVVASDDGAEHQSMVLRRNDEPSGRRGSRRGRGCPRLSSIWSSPRRVVRIAASRRPTRGRRDSCGGDGLAITVVVVRGDGT